jgi:4-amino-4-deoxy-L-arabinose transferase-like glycosyltransferase
MLKRLSEAQRWGLIVAGFALALAALNLWWVLTYRDGYPFDIDEAGYTAFGLVDYLALDRGGIGAWWDAIQAQGRFAPLVPALTSILVWIHPGVLNGFAVLTGFVVLLAMATYGIGSRLAGPKLGALAAVATATLPGTFAFSRQYSYALPVAALLASAVYALLRSDGLRSRPWSILCGLALGLMLLSRTMAIVFVPGVLGAAALTAYVRSQEDTGRRLVNGALLVVTAAAVAATWYARNLDSVVDYLTNYGYGSQAEFYGEQHALVSWGRFRSVGEEMIEEDLLLPVAFFVLAALAALLVAVVKKLGPRDGRRDTLRSLAGSDAMVPVLVVVAGYGALMSSQNVGNGFTIPLSVLLPPIAVLALRRFPRAAVPALAAFACIAVLNTVSTATVWSTASQTRSVSIPAFSDPLPVTKGVPKALFTLREQIGGSETVFDEGDARWVQANERLVEKLRRLYAPGEVPIVAFASRNRVVSSNSVQMAALLKYQEGLPLVQLEPEPGNTVATYADQLRHSPAGEVTAMVSIVPNTGDYPPLVSQSKAATAARRVGLAKIDRLRLPDGRSLYLWSSRGPANRQATQRSRPRRSNGTRHAASATMAPLIFDLPARRSWKTIGTSATSNPPLSAR